MQQLGRRRFFAFAPDASVDHLDILEWRIPFIRSVRGMHPWEMHHLPLDDAALPTTQRNPVDLSHFLAGVETNKNPVSCMQSLGPRKFSKPLQWENGDGVIDFAGDLALLASAEPAGGSTVAPENRRSSVDGRFPTRASFEDSSPHPVSRPVQHLPFFQHPGLLILADFSTYSQSDHHAAQHRFGSPQGCHGALAAS